MSSPFDFGDVKLRQFNAEQTAKFFRSLLRAEASARNIGIQSTHVPVRVNIPDGGLDTKAQNDSDSRTQLIPIGKVGINSNEAISLQRIANGRCKTAMKLT